MKPEQTSPGRSLRRSFGWRLSRLGERLGCDWMTYNPIVMEFFHATALSDAPKVVGCLEEIFSPVRIADVGCGSGAFAAEFARRGHPVRACEWSAHGRELARRQGLEVAGFDLNRVPPCSLEGPFDLAYSFEVAEHLPPHLGDRLVDFLVGRAPLVVFTAAQPGQGGTGHINEQPPGYWAEKFRRGGHAPDPAATERLKAAFRQAGASNWFARNVGVFRRGSAPEI